jgi:hypothetical protein
MGSVLDWDGSIFFHHFPSVTGSARPHTGRCGGGQATGTACAQVQLPVRPSLSTYRSTGSGPRSGADRLRLRVAGPAPDRELGKDAGPVPPAARCPGTAGAATRHGPCRDREKATITRMTHMIARSHHHCQGNAAAAGPGPGPLPPPRPSMTPSRRMTQPG